MLGRGEIFGNARLFGVDIRFTSDREEVLEAAMALCPSEDALPLETPAQVSIAFKSGSPGPDASEADTVVEGRCLTWYRGGIYCHAHGGRGEGYCFLPDSLTPDRDGPFAESFNTLTLFLVAQAGRAPLHASAVMLGEKAFILAGRSGSGKSSLALAADRAGLGVLSDDTIYVQTTPRLRVWARPQAIHVFERDAPENATGPLRYRSGRWKRALPITAAHVVAERAALCVLERGTTPGLQPLDVEEAVAILTSAPEPGYEFYGQRSEEIIRALARGGCWRLTLSSNPDEAIDLLRRRFEGQEQTFHVRYASLISAIERRFPVDCWHLGDLPVWPLARFDLYLDMHRAAFGSAMVRHRPLPVRLGAALARPLINRWRTRRDWVHQLRQPKPAHAVLLGDGVSLDRADGAYQDRFGEPVMAALERQGKETFLMQPGDLSRLPWRRQTFAASLVESKAWLRSLLSRRQPVLPQYDILVAFLADKGIEAPSLERRALAKRAQHVAAAARVFARILDKVNPALAFVVNAAAGLGPAFVLACRRKGILSVELQRCPRAGAPMAHGWSKLPANGYATLPAVFWTWEAAEPPCLPPSDWHRDLHGGHAQLAPFLEDDDPITIAWDVALKHFAGTQFEREILVALQPLEADELWNELTEVIAAAPPTWRWWIRRHPAMRPEQDAIFGRLLSLHLPNVLIDPPFPLPALLRHMSALVSLASGAAVEASWFGVPALFLSPEAQGPFGSLFATCAAHLVAISDLVTAIARLPARPQRPVWKQPPPMAQTLNRLEDMARHYAIRTKSGS